MSATAIEWAGVIVFFLVFWGFTFGEAAWLSKRGWAPFAKSLAFSIITNLSGLMIGSIAVFVTLMFMIMLVYEPRGGRTTTEAMMWVGLILIFIFPPIFLMLAKRLCLRFFRMGNDKPVWTFSAVSSFLTVFLSAGLPSVLLYFVIRGN